MKSGNVRIKELRIRVPGLTREEGRRLGQLVAKQLSDAVRNQQGTKSAAEISLRLRSDNKSVDRLASDVTAQVRRKVK